VEKHEDEAMGLPRDATRKKRRAIAYSVEELPDGGKVRVKTWIMTP
jgi:hypothetical protein